MPPPVRLAVGNKGVRAPMMGMLRSTAREYVTVVCSGPPASAYEPFCDGVFECWTTKQLEGFVNALTDPHAVPRAR